jgi:DNA end-binding protein Ku
MALDLINQLTQKFEPKKYKDEYQEELKDLIKRKAKGKKITIRGKAPKPTKTTDIMALLKASLEEHARERAKVR